MPSQPLNPFPPSTLFSHLPAGVSPSAILLAFFWLAIAYWAVYTLIAIYHWIKYSHASWVAYPAIAVHVAVSLALISYAFSGLL